MPANQTNASTPSLPERAAHREWIGGRALTLLSHYWRDDDPVELTAAIGQDWADVLEGIPQDVIQRACIRYQRENERKKPTPGAIYQLCRKSMPAPHIAALPPLVKMSREEEERYRCTIKKVDPDRARQADEIIKKAGFALRKVGQ